MVDFDLQTYLMEWRREQREDAAAMHETFQRHTEDDLQEFSKIDLHFAEQGQDLKQIKETHKNLRWMARSVFAAATAAFFLFLFDLLSNHLPTYLATPR